MGPIALITGGNPAIGNASCNAGATVLPIGPDGNISPAGIPALFANGFIGNPEVFERDGRAHVSAFYTVFDRHLLRMGVGFNYPNIWKAKESKNFGIDPSIGTRIEPPGSRLVEITDTPFAFLSEGDRKDQPTISIYKKLSSVEERRKSVSKNC